MDSGNSGSMQSSSGGDEEYDSRAETISAFLNNHHHHHSSHHVGPMPNPPPPQQPPPSHHHSSMFDPLSNYFDPLSSRSSPQPPLQAQLGGSNSNHPNSLLNLDMVWSKNLRSEPNCTDLGGFIASSSSSSTQQLLTNQAVLQGRSSSFPAMQLHESVTKGSLSGSSSVSGINIDQTNINSNNNSGMVRNPKKRSRASRRAPTTVLTTDTTNFRAMVQEFTGIPAPPFTSSPFPRTRLDLFGTSSTLRSTNTHLDPSPPPYLLRPFAQKFHPPPFISPSTVSSSSASSSFPTSSMIDTIASTTTNITSSAAGSAGNNTNNSNSNSTPINYQLPSDHHLGLLKPQQPQNLLNMNNMQNPILNLQSFLQAPAPPPVLGNKPPQAGSLDIPTNDSHHLKIGVYEELGLSHGHLNTNLVVSDATLPIRSDNNNNSNSNNNHPSNWPAAGDGTGSNENDQGLLRSISGGNFNSSQRVTNGKVNNFSSSSSDFLRDKGQENVATTTRTEGMVESWICSSD